MFASVLLFATLACDDYDKWSTSPSDGLRFSCDTVQFGTVISEQSSPTQTLWLWNDNADGLRIKEVRLAEGSASLFRVMVDGQYLYQGQGTDFEVRRKDSLCVRVEVKVPDVDSDELHKHRDRLVFMLESGRQQEVILEADGMDVYILRDKRIEGDETLHAGRPYLIYDSLVVAPDASLNIEPGARLLFHDGVSLIVHGTLRALGNAEQPIVFRGDRMDHLSDYLPYDNTTNRWGGIHLASDSHDNVLENCDVHSGDYGILCDSAAIINPESPVLTLRNSIVHNVAGDALAIVCNSVIVEGTQLSNALGCVVKILGGHVLFAHCTMAQFYPWAADRGRALFLVDHLGEGTERVEYPLLSASFFNSIITGYADDEVEFSLTDTQDQPSPWLLSHCLLRTPRTTDARLVEVIFDDAELSPNGKDHFTLFDTDNFLYDFTPVSKSIVRGKADVTVTLSLANPQDRHGRARVHEDGTADLGSESYTEE